MVSNNPQEIVAPSLSHQTVLDLLKSRAGLIFPEIRLNEIFRVMDKAAAAASFTLPQYAYNLSVDNASFDALCNEVTIAESYFFRDPKHFEFVKNRVIPEWRNTAFQQGQLQAWSAGCSTGEEAYSLAILMEQEGMSSLYKLTATDICRKSLALAARGAYNPWSLRIADQHFLHNHFDNVESQFHIKSRYKNLVNFAHLNLVSQPHAFYDLGLKDLDLIFCRNVLIYFDATAIARVIQTFHSLLKPGGYLILGPSDPAASQYANFDVVVCDYGVFYQKTNGPSSAPIFITAADVLKQTAASEKKLAAAKEQEKRNKVEKKMNQSTYNPPLGSPASTPATQSSTGYNSVSAKKLNDSDILEQAQSAYSHGLYEKAFLLTGNALDNEKVAILHIKALANFKGSAQAEKVLARLISQHTNSFHLQYLHGHLLMDLNLLDQALAALKRCLYLDPRIAMAHFTLGQVQKNLGDRAGAQRSFRNVVDLCKGLPPDDILPFGEGERVKILVTASNAELANLSAPLETDSKQDIFKKVDR